MNAHGLRSFWSHTAHVSPQSLQMGLHPGQARLSASIVSEPDALMLDFLAALDVVNDATAEPAGGAALRLLHRFVEIDVAIA
ncbi:hypothetical protein FGO68_gene6397 [Halteria grandinella]|uniref:Uncharacterized protein n=1 Tax=Halteria grandinella TaxID=5974 RepID=A0A8J8NDU8_HALGN|nr:hypothetical protein FGO68_gene6397 [Halteria grandinella]